MHLSETQRAHLLDIARLTIRHRLVARDDETIPPPLSLSVLLNDPDLQQLAGCFVSLHELGTNRLRGCVGCLDAKHPLAIAVHEGAESVLMDPRFEDKRVRLEELSKLEIEITVLSPLEDAAHTLDFDPLQQGIYLTIGDASGCFLPQVARETGWSREQLLDRLSYEKLGMSRDAWRSPDAKLQRFTTTIIGPEPFAPLPP
jgi:AmmeMemoRadiSam system protein A